MTAEPAQRARRWPLALVITLALAVRLPALALGFFSDDNGLMLVLERPIEHPTLRWWSLFDFGFAPDPGHESAAWSFLPWWTSPDWKVRFFRPLASLTHAADFALWGRNAALHHATSLALFALLLVLLHRMYRALELSPAVALCAVAVFAFEDGGTMPVAWLANRNALLEAVFACAAVLVLARGGPAPSLARIAASFALALCACLSKESGVVTFAALALWLAARRAKLAPGADMRRVTLAATCALAAGLAYGAWLVAAGYGTRSLFYLMPWLHPAAYALRTLEMVVLGAPSALGPFPIDVAMFFPALEPLFLALALVLGWPVVLCIARRERALPNGAFLAAWGVLALLPQAGTLPSSRLLFVPMIGFAPWIGAYVRHAFERLPWRARWLPALVACSALLLSGVLAFLNTASLVSVAAKTRAATLSAEVPRDGRACDAFVLQSGSILSMLSPDAAWVFVTGLECVRFHPLQVGRAALRIRTLDERAFELETLDGPMLASPFEQVFLSRREAYEPGRTWRGRGFTVTCLAADEAGPRRIRIELDEPIASERWRFLAWREGAFRALVLPPPGGARELSAAEPLDPLMP